VIAAPLSESDLQGACGLYCGLCPRNQAPAASRCPGCQLGDQHSYCSVWRCAVKTHGYLTCAECDDYPCGRLKRCIGEGADSFISHRPAYSNLERIRDTGLDQQLASAKVRRQLVEELMARYNDGRSMSFFCVAGALLPPETIHQALAEVDESIRQGHVDGSDLKARARAMRRTLEELARESGVELALRHAPAAAKRQT